MSDFGVSVLIGLVFVSASICLVLGMYFLARQLLHPGMEGDRTHDAAAAVAVRIAALHGLILALVYAQELDDYKGIRTNLTEEAVAVSDVYNDARRYGGDEVAAIQAGLADYLQSVVGEEWKLLGQRQSLSANAWREWNGVYEEVLDLQPQTDRQRYLDNRMRQRMGDIAKFRQIRETTALAGYSGLFWAPAIIGLALLAVPFYIYRPSRSHLVLLSIFGAYSGIILFFIFAFSNPFSEPGKLEPKPFQHLLAGEIGRSVSPRK